MSGYKLVKYFYLSLTALFFLLVVGISNSYSISHRIQLENGEWVPAALVYMYPHYGEGKFGEPVEVAILEGKKAFIKISGVEMSTGEKIEEDIIARVTPIFKESVTLGFSFVDLKRMG